MTVPGRQPSRPFALLVAALAALYLGVLLASTWHLIPWARLYRPDSSWFGLAHTDIGPRTVVLCGAIAGGFLAWFLLGLLLTTGPMHRAIGPGPAMLWGRLASFLGILAVATCVGLWVNRGRTLTAAPPADQLVMPHDGPQLAVALFLHPADTDGIVITFFTVGTVFLFSVLALVYARRLLHGTPRLLDALSYLAALIVSAGIWIALDRMFPGDPMLPLSANRYRQIVMLTLLGVPLSYLLLCVEVGLAQWRALRQGWRDGRRVRAAIIALALGVWVAAVIGPVLGGLYLALWYEPPANGIILDRNGTLIDLRNPGYSSLYVPARHIPPIVLKAVESIEDPGLLRSPATHSAVNPITMIGSVTRIVGDGSMTGGSGIAAQVCKMASGTPLSSQLTGRWAIPLRLVEKIGESPCAWTLEKIAGPEKTLSLWLNMANYSCLGDYGAAEVRGIAAASWVYYNKPVDQLDVHEAALLARLPQNPCGIFAWGERDSMVDGRNAVIRAMAERQGYLTLDEASWYMSLPLGIAADPVMPPGGGDAFIEQAMAELDRDGYEGFSTNGWTVVTTLDSAQQTALEDACRSVIWQQPEGEANDCGAILLHRSATDPDRFEVTAYVGTLYTIAGPDAMPDLVSQQHLPPGSTIKGPLYACALDHGVLATDEWLDDPGTTYFGDQKVANWDNGAWGTRPAGEMLAGSRNVPAAELVDRLTPEGFTRCLSEQFGIATPLGLHWGVKLGIGLSEISLWELAVSYTPMATSGELIEPVMVDEVTDRAGERQDLDGPAEPRRVIDCGESAWVTDALLSVGAGHGLPGGVAAKTGTTDAASVAVVYTPDWVLAAWVGRVVPKEPLQEVHPWPEAIEVARQFAWWYYPGGLAPAFSPCEE